MNSSRNYFGTDGIRGKVGQSLINPEFVLKLGWAVGKVLASSASRGHVIIGKDTRVSGYMLESALEAGLSAAGVDIHLLGPMPTPAIAYLTQTLRAKAGIVISASHNLYQDNGIKFFSADGRKLPDEIEIAIEKQLAEPFTCVSSKALGKAVRIVDASGRYIEFCKSTVPSRTSLNGLKVVVDCANGATYHVAPDVFRELGAEVIEISVGPNGFNINDRCGSTCPELVQKHVLAHQADVGIALDGDGDRVIMVDHKGEIVDGDELLFIIAKHLHGKGQLKGGVVGTVMSNMGMEQALLNLGIPFARSQVGDRYVMDELVRKGWLLGGETSGHIINFNFSQTGDGTIAALQVLSAMNESGQSLHELKKHMTKYPQSIRNIETNHAKQILQMEALQINIKQVERDLSNSRILIRASGTEPVIRIMVEGQDKAIIDGAAERLYQLIHGHVAAVK